MKIDFLSSYSELQRSLQHHRQSRASGDSDFRQELSQRSEIIGEKADSKRSEPLSQDIKPPPFQTPLARLGQTPRELLAPPVELIKPEPSVNEPAPSVKTPRIVRVERQEGRPEPAMAREIIGRIAPSLGIDPALGTAVARAESSFNPLAVSRDGFESKGLFQLLDNTARTVIEREGLSTQFDPFNPEDSAKVGLHYLRYLHDVFAAPTRVGPGLESVAAANSTSLEKLAVAAYNAGEGRVTGAQARALGAGKDPSEYDQVRPYLPKITQGYVDRVFRFRESE